MKPIIAATLALLAATAARGANSVTPWVPIFKGIEHASGTNNGTSIQLSVEALRVDLQDPDIRLMVTPSITVNYISDQRETLLQTPREFMLEHRVQVAVNGCWFFPAGYNYPSGTPAWVAGTVISQGRTVSTQTSTNDSLSAVFITTNNQATFSAISLPPVVTEGIYTALPGLYPVLVNGENISYAYTNAAGFDSIHQRQPRTALGLSEDNRYLILVTIDGRQQISDGAFDYETAEFLLLFGAWNAMNMDGGGSTCMVKADECGAPIDLNRNSFQDAVGRPGSQRPVGCNLGVYAASLPQAIQNVDTQPGSTTALLTWQTDFPATTQVLYGSTTNYGSATALDSRMVHTHVATLTGLVPGSNYFFRALSSDGDIQHAFSCTLSTTSSFNRSLVFELTNAWKFTTNNMDGTNWKLHSYDDSAWSGPSNGCLHIENANLQAQAPYPPLTTWLPPGFGGQILRTYYFRTPFQYSGSSAGVSLTFSNYIDDGAVFYLNGNELARIRLPAAPTVIGNGTAATSSPCNPPYGDAVVPCPDIFTSSAAGAALLQGLNTVAVEVHNTSSGTLQDMVFGSALFLNRPGTASPKLFISSEGGQSTLYWNGQGFTLQQSTDLTSPANWADVPGPVTQSPVIVDENGTIFYRLRN